jgi:hypothetical protein
MHHDPLSQWAFLPSRTTRPQRATAWVSNKDMLLTGDLSKSSQSLIPSPPSTLPLLFHFPLLLGPLHITITLLLLHRGTDSREGTVILTTLMATRLTHPLDPDAATLTGEESMAPPIPMSRDTPPLPIPPPTRLDSVTFFDFSPCFVSSPCLYSCLLDQPLPSRLLLLSSLVVSLLSSPLPRWLFIRKESGTASMLPQLSISALPQQRSTESRIAA